MPDFLLERTAGGRVAGVDEAGRGPLAGPVLVAALHASRRAEIGVGAASVAEIAALNILRATLLAMQRAVARLPIPPDMVLIDGPITPPLPCPARPVVDGDRLCLSIAAASII